jgi:hypothetical protein
MFRCMLHYFRCALWNSAYETRHRIYAYLKIFVHSQHLCENLVFHCEIYTNTETSSSFYKIHPTEHVMANFFNKSNSSQSLLDCSSMKHWTPRRKILPLEMYFTWYNYKLVLLQFNTDNCRKYSACLWAIKHNGGKKLKIYTDLSK